VSPQVHTPASLEQLQEIVAGADQIRVAGTGHSFNACCESEHILSLEAMPKTVSVHERSSTATVSGALTYAEVAAALCNADVALHNLASLPHISVAGAIATATHGSGDRFGNLATAVSGLEIVRSDGEIVIALRGAEDFDGLVVGLGSVGVVTHVTLDVEPDYAVRQDVFTDLSWDVFLERFDDVMGAGDSVSAFTTWAGPIDQIWVKRRVSHGIAAAPDLFGARPATRDLHPIATLDAANCTEQLGVAGRWCDRLPHFRTGFMPSSADELQSEFFVDRSAAADAISAVRALGGTLRPLLLVSEIRTIAADRLWMSPQYGRDSVGIHFTWRNVPAVHDVVLRIEDALASFDARPHWGKLYSTGNASSYPRLADFVGLLDRFDPRGAFWNDWLVSALQPRL
jgi:xylitol oxidase